MKANKVNEIITDKIIRQLESNNLKWLKDWSLGLGCNWTTLKEYRGINAILVQMSLTERGYKNNQWLTFNQIKQNKGRLNKGSKATPIIYYNIKEFCSCGVKGCEKYLDLSFQEGHKKKKSFLLRYYNVFNIGDTDLKPKETESNNKPIEDAEKILNQYWDFSKIELGNPAYLPRKDIIHMPSIKNFKTTEGFYSALTHELIHSTGHKERLDRKGITEIRAFGDENHAYEELIAELGSAFLCAKLGIEKDITNTSAYIENWLKALRKDKTFIFRVSKEAQKSQEFIISQSELNSMELREAVAQTIKCYNRAAIRGVA